MNNREAWSEIQKAVNIRKRIISEGRSRKPANYHQALSRVQQWLSSYPYPTNDTLQRFLLEYGTELDRIIPNNASGDAMKMRIRTYITGLSNA